MRSIKIAVCVFTGEGQGDRNLSHGHKFFNDRIFLRHKPRKPIHPDAGTLNIPIVGNVFG